MGVAQRQINNNSNNQSNSNKRIADAWARVRIVVRTGEDNQLVKHTDGKYEGETAKFWFTQDIPLYATNANGEPQPMVQRMIDKLEQDPDYVFDAQIEVKLPGQSETNYDLLDF